MSAHDLFRHLWLAVLAALLAVAGVLATASQLGDGSVAPFIFTLF